MKTANALEIATPGRILQQEFLEPSALTQKDLAEALGIPQPRMNELIRGRRRLTADDALRLARYWGNEPQFWLNLQATHDLLTARREHEKEIRRRVRPRKLAIA